MFQVAPGCLFPRVCAASVTVPAGGERVNCVRRVLYMVVPALFSLHPSQYIESRKAASCTQRKNQSVTMFISCRSSLAAAQKPERVKDDDRSTSWRCLTMVKSAGDNLMKQGPRSGDAPALCGGDKRCLGFLLPVFGSALVPRIHSVCRHMGTMFASSLEHKVGDDAHQW